MRVEVYLDHRKLVDRYGNPTENDLLAGEHELESDKLAEMRKFQSVLYYIRDDLSKIPFVVMLTYDIQVKRLVEK